LRTTCTATGEGKQRFRLMKKGENLGKAGEKQRKKRGGEATDFLDVGDKAGGSVDVTLRPRGETQRVGSSGRSGPVTLKVSRPSREAIASRSYEGVRVFEREARGGGRMGENQRPKILVLRKKDRPKPEGKRPLTTWEKASLCCRY